nr:MAG TPA: Protein spaetzle knot, Toll ligand, Antimicrobial.4A [Bacteriophage sp.]
MFKPNFSQIKNGADISKALESNFIENNLDGKWKFIVNEDGNLALKYGDKIIGDPWKKPTE